MHSNIDAIFSPRSIAVIGASRESGRIGHDVLKNLIEGGFTGPLYPINPKTEGDILGRTVYASLSDIGEPVDLIVFAVPAPVVAGVLKEAGTLGVRGAIIITAGFKETGNATGEEELKAIAREYNIALVGPNCLGVISLVSHMNASFATRMPGQGTVGFLSQSGAVCTAVLDKADELGIGFSHFVSMGNKALVSETELLEFFLHDEATTVIGMYIEDIVDPKAMVAMLATARKQGLSKPIIALKSGRTEVGASASASHTGALAGKDEAYDAFFAQTGIIRADRMSQFFDFVRGFAQNPLPKGSRVAIITNAGGPGVLATDAVVRAGLLVPTLSSVTQDALAPHVPKAASTHNPVDLLGDARAERYTQALTIVGGDPEVDALLVLLTPQTSTEVEATAQAIVTARETTKKPIVASFMGGATVQAGADLLTKAGVTVTAFPEEGATVLGELVRYSTRESVNEESDFSLERVDAKKASELLALASANGRTGIPEAEAITILSAYGFPTLASVVVTTREDAEREALRINAPLVMKIVSDDILHKSDAGGVRLNIDPKNAGDEYDALMETVRRNKPDARLDGVLIVEMAPKGGTEIILGVIKDPALGHLIMVGLGGIYVEVLKDVAFGVAPIRLNDARRMVDSLKTRKLLDGVRGGPALDIDALIDALGRLSQFIVEHPEAIELDMNPLLVLPKGQGARVLDARIIVG
jgi:acetate---CoA ligase (ADP-forming)